MADRPIIFSAPMVRALLEGRKTQTRRLLGRGNTLFNGDKWPPELRFEDMKLEQAWVDGGPSPAGNPGPYLKADWPYGRMVEQDDRSDSEWLMARLYPRIQPGDRLYVREAWRTWKDHDEVAPRDLVKSISPVFYEADRDNCDRHGRHRQGMHMPRWASRLTLTVSNVRIQRVCEISEDDARAEGVDPAKWILPVAAFRELWNSLHAKPGATWADNPWIVALTFSVEQRNIDG